MATIKRFKTHSLVYFFVAFMTAFLAVAIANHRVIAKQLDDWQLLPRPEGVTELYFADDKLLPAAVRMESPQNVVFAVRNIEHETTTYQYKVAAIAQDSLTGEVLSAGVVQLKHDESRTISEVVKIPPGAAPRMAIQVELEYQGISFGSRTPSAQHQAIRYWVDVVGRKV